MIMRKYVKRTIHSRDEHLRSGRNERSKRVFPGGHNLISNQH